MAFREKRLFILQISSKLTASSAKILFNSRLPQCRHKALINNGVWEQLSLGKSTFVMCLCDHLMKGEVEEIIQYVVKSQDITDYLVNEDKYIFIPRQIKKFNYQKFERMYKERYLIEAPVEYAQSMINILGNKSRYQDHQVILKHKRKQ